MGWSLGGGGVHTGNVPYDAYAGVGGEIDGNVAADKASEYVVGVAHADEGVSGFVVDELLLGLFALSDGGAEAEAVFAVVLGDEVGLEFLVDDLVAVGRIDVGHACVHSVHIIVVGTDVEAELVGTFKGEHGADECVNIIDVGGVVGAGGQAGDAVVSAALLTLEHSMLGTFFEVGDDEFIVAFKTAAEFVVLGAGDVEGL